MFLLTAAVLLACVPQATPQLQQHTLHEQSAHYSIDIKYPEIENDDLFNAAVHHAVASLTAPSKKDLPEGAAPDFPEAAYLKGSYSAAILNNGIVSVLLDYDEYAPGAAHPWDVMASVNYDSRTCRVLALSDLFRPGVNYVARISKLAIADLDQGEYADQSIIRHGAGPVASNFKVFTLTDTALVLHFPMAQVAATAAGAQTAVIPLEKLAPWLIKTWLNKTRLRKP